MCSCIAKSSPRANQMIHLLPAAGLFVRSANAHFELLEDVHVGGNEAGHQLGAVNALRHRGQAHQRVGACARTRQCAVRASAGYPFAKQQGALLPRRGH